MSGPDHSGAAKQIAIGVVSAVIAGLILWAIIGHDSGGPHAAPDSTPSLTSVLTTTPPAPTHPSAKPTTRSSSPPATASAPTYFTVSLSTYYGEDDSIEEVVGGRLVKFRSAADSGYQGGGGSSSTCRSITVTAGIPDSQARYATSGTLQVIAERTGGGSLTVPTHKVVSKTITLNEGGFAFAVAVDGDAGLYWTASLSCLTPTGQ